MPQPRTNAGNGNIDVLVVGGYFCDVIITGLKEIPRLGYEVWGDTLEIHLGGSGIPVVAMHRLGLRVAWPCFFGNDLFSRYAREQVLLEGLDDRWFIDLDHGLRNISFSYSIAQERAFVSFSDSMALPDYPDLIRQICPNWILITSLWQGAKLGAIVEAARQSNSQVFMDCQAHETSVKNEEVTNALRKVDVFSPNIEEALYLTNTTSVEKALDVLAALVPLVVIKLGQDGAIAQRGDQRTYVPGISVNAFDTTGAGDNFDSGFVYAQIRGYSLEESLQCANVCGGLSTKGCGGTPFSPSVHELEEKRSEFYSSLPGIAR